jgi:hypothetical protein
MLLGITYVLVCAAEDVMPRMVVPKLNQSQTH